MISITSSATNSKITNLFLSLLFLLLLNHAHSITSSPFTPTILSRQHFGLTTKGRPPLHTTVDRTAVLPRGGHIPLGIKLNTNSSDTSLLPAATANELLSANVIYNDDETINARTLKEENSVVISSKKAKELDVKDGEACVLPGRNRKSVVVLV